MSVLTGMRDSLTGILKRMKFRNAALLLAFSAAVAAFCICDLLTTWHALLWPADVNTVVVAWMGGSVSKSLSGALLFELGWGTTFVRVASLLIVQVTVASLIRRGEPSRPRQLVNAVTGMSVSILAGCSWWAIGFVQKAFIPSVGQTLDLLLPLWITIAAGFTTWFGLSVILPPARENARVLAASLLAAGILGWVAVSFWMNLRLYENVLIPHGDSAMYEEHIWNIREGKGFRSYLDQGLFWGEHFQFIHLILLPVHALWPSHLMLEFAESLALASCAVPVFLMTRRHTNSAWAGTLMGLAWLLYYPMHYLDIAIDLKTFRPLALGIPFVFWMIEFCERRRFLPGIICLLIALSAKEDVALVTCPLLAVMAWLARSNSDSASQQVDSTKRPALWLGGMAGFSAIWLVFVIFWGIPGFRDGEAVHYSRYFGDLGSSPGELIRNAISQPRLVIGRFLSGRTLLYVLAFLGPLALVPLRRWPLLLAGMSSFGMLALLQLETDDSGLPIMPYHHFHGPLLPVLIWTCIRALWARSKTSQDSVRLAGLVLTCCITTSVTGSLMPCGATFWSTESGAGRKLYSSTDPGTAKRGEMALIVQQQIPLSARVASTDYIHTRLTHCERSYDYSDYPRAVNNYQPGVPEDTDFIVIDTTHWHSTYRVPEEIPELRDSPETWELMPDTTEGYFVILRRRTSDQNLNDVTGP